MRLSKSFKAYSEVLWIKDTSPWIKRLCSALGKLSITLGLALETPLDQDDLRSRVRTSKSFHHMQSCFGSRMVNRGFCRGIRAWITTWINSWILHSYCDPGLDQGLDQGLDSGLESSPHIVIQAWLRAWIRARIQALDPSLIS